MTDEPRTGHHLHKSAGRARPQRPALVQAHRARSVTSTASAHGGVIMHQQQRGPGALAGAAGIANTEQLDDTTAQNDKPAKPSRLRLLEWRPRRQNTLYGFCTIELPCGLIIRDIAVHQKGQRSWICFPGRPVVNSEGRRTVNPAGHRPFTAVLNWRDQDLADRFSRTAIDIVLAAHPDALGNADDMNTADRAWP